MRFKKIEKFNVDDLHLDQGNYRFKKAVDQKDCIKKINSLNPQYFKGLMKSIAEDDLGEPLLVFHNEGENIVADGNRRLSALKVLYDDDYAPTEAIKNYANDLRVQNKIAFSKIHAQVSEDKKLISRTVYERHSGGKDGTSRIPWNAYAAARFGFVEHIGNSKEWRIMALLSRTEKKNPTITPFLDSSEFSFEVFRRLTRAALEKGKISENIFSERGESIKKAARKDLVRDAVTKTLKFLSAMKKKDISLSRKDGNYADKDTIEEYLNSFKLSPDNQKLENAKNSSGNGATEDSTETKEGNEGKSKGDSSNESNDNGDTNDDDNNDTQTTSEKSGHGIDESKAILQKLRKLKSKKLSGLYNSLCIVSLKKHPALMYVGAWSFLEVLSKHMGNTTIEFTGFFGNKMKDLGIEKLTGKDCTNALKDIQKFGNATKHSKIATPMSATQLKNDFEVLEPLIAAALDKAKAQQKGTA